MFLGTFPKQLGENSGDFLFEDVEYRCGTAKGRRKSSAVSKDTRSLGDLPGASPSYPPGTCSSAENSPASETRRSLQRM